jgi:Cation transporter/ATPase, N-terminus
MALPESSKPSALPSVAAITVAADSATRPPWHHMDLLDVLRHLAVEPSTGLSGSDAARRLVESCGNELLLKGPTNVWRIV